MTIAPTLEKLFDGAIGAPTIIETKEGFLRELFPVLGQFNLSFRMMPMFNMASTFLTRRTIDEIADLGFVENIFVDWPVKIPELPIGFAVADFVTKPGMLGLRMMQTGLSNMARRAEVRKEWVPTTESRRYLGVEDAFDDEITGAGVKVGVADSDGSVRAANHRQFLDKYIKRTSVKKAFQTDTNGHGTHVATTIAGGPYEAMPDVHVGGISPDAELFMVKCLLTPIGTGSTSDCIEAVNLAFSWGADVVNLSLGSECKNPVEDPFVRAVNKLPKGDIVVAASGNNGVAEVGSPAVAENALAVGALDVRTGMKADFSNSGPELDFVMPGVNIFSGIARETLLDVTGAGPEAFSALSGTSMATPHMTGMIALAVDLMKRYGFRPTTDTIREIGRRYGENHTDDRGYGPLTYGMIKKYVDENLT